MLAYRLYVLEALAVLNESENKYIEVNFKK